MNTCLTLAFAAFATAAAAQPWDSATAARTFETVVTDSYPVFPKDLPAIRIEKDDGLVDASVYEDAVIPADFALTVHFRKREGGTAHLIWEYDKASVFKMAVTPSEKGGPVRIVLPDGALVLTRDPANPKGAIATFAPN